MKVCDYKQRKFARTGDIRSIFTVLAIPENNVELIHAVGKVTQNFTTF